MRTATAQSYLLQLARFLQLSSFQLSSRHRTIRRLTLSAALATVAMTSSGCSLCQPGYLCDYAGVGGKWQRTDLENGRVGSVLSDPNSVVGQGFQPAAVIADEGEVYLDADGGQSIMDLPPTTEEGVIILGDSW